MAPVWTHTPVLNENVGKFLNVKQEKVHTENTVSSHLPPKTPTKSKDKNPGQIVSIGSKFQFVFLLRLCSPEQVQFWPEHCLAGSSFSTAVKKEERRRKIQSPWPALNYTSASLPVLHTCSPLSMSYKPYLQPSLWFSKRPSFSGLS